MSKYATPLRSRCSSAALSTSPYNQTRFDAVHVNIGNRLNLLEEKSPISISPTSRSSIMDHDDITNILAAVNRSLKND